MAGSSTFPTSVDNKTALADGIDIIQADDVNNAYIPMTSTQTFVGANGKGASWSTDILDYFCNAKDPIVTKATANTLSVSTGAVLIKNSGQTNRLFRKNVAAVTVTSSNLDTGSMADVTAYYVYAVADSAATTFTVKISASATAPSGLTNFELIGWFWNQAAGSLTVTDGFVGNVKANGRNAPNYVILSATSTSTVNDTSYGTDLTGTIVKFYSSGRPVRMTFTCKVARNAGDHLPSARFNVDTVGQTGSERGDNLQTSNQAITIVLDYAMELAAGVHTIYVEAKVDANSSDWTTRSIVVVEL